MDIANSPKSLTQNFRHESITLYATPLDSNLFKYATFFSKYLKMRVIYLLKLLDISLNYCSNAHLSKHFKHWGGIHLNESGTEILKHNFDEIINV